MANQVNAEQTLNEFRNSFNTLNNEVGSITGLRGTLNNPNSLVDAINVLEDKTFFLQTFEYTTTTDQSYSGADANGNVLKYRQGKVQVYLDGVHLVEGGAGANGYTIQIPQGLFYTGIFLNAAPTAGQVLTVYAYTGSQSGVAADGGAGGGQFTETAENTIYNINSNGVILNGTSAAAVSLQSGYQVQLEGNTFVDGNVKVDTGHSLEAPTLTDGTATITGGVGTGFSSLTSTSLVGNLTGNVTGDITGDVKHGGSVVLDASTGALTGQVSDITNHQITDLSDVDTTAPSDGQILVYNASSSKYVPTNQQTSDTVTEGSSNLYFTNERVDDRVNALIVGGTGISTSYNDAAGTLTINGSAQYGDSDVQSYLSGGSGLAMSGSGVFSVNTSNGVKIDGDDVELDYEIVNSAPSSAGSTSTGHLWFVV